MLNNLQNLQGKVVIKKYNSKYLENCKSKPSKNCLPQNPKTPKPQEVIIPTQVIDLIFQYIQNGRSYRFKQ